MGALGRRGHGEHKNKAIRGHLGSRRSGFGSYGRGNFPGHHVLGSLSKMVWMVVDGCKLVWIGAYTPISNGGNKNKEKRAPNG